MPSAAQSSFGVMPSELASRASKAGAAAAAAAAASSSSSSKQLSLRSRLLAFERWCDVIADCKAASRRIFQLGTAERMMAEN